ncbi:MAG: shikimate kinase [Acidobacteriota bacterium]
MRVYLTGFMGAGKTVVGRELADVLDLRFVDLDDAIVASSTEDSVATIFARHGEATFRDLERRALARTEERDDLVVACGGGALVSADNRALVAELGTTVWLDPAFELIVTRLGDRDDSRPLFRDPERAHELWRQRRDAYGRADLRIDVDPEATPRDLAARIADLLRGTSCAT